VKTTEHGPKISDQARLEAAEDAGWAQLDHDQRRFLVGLVGRNEALILWRVMCAAARAMDDYREDGDVR
jgi:hypothetical protein